MKAEENGQTIEPQIELVTSALAPVLLPMIDSLRALEIESALSTVASGEATSSILQYDSGFGTENSATEDLLQSAGLSHTTTISL